MLTWADRDQHRFGFNHSQLSPKKVSHFWPFLLFAQTRFGKNQTGGPRERFLGSVLSCFLAAAAFEVSVCVRVCACACVCVCVVGVRVGVCMCVDVRESGCEQVRVDVGVDVRESVCEQGRVCACPSKRVSIEISNS